MGAMEPLTDREFHSDVAGLYGRLHREQTLERARALRGKYAARRLGRATVRQRFEALAGIRDESDADLEGMSQLGHALQTANAMRRDGLDEDWIVLGLIHDLGKILLEHGEPPEFVVGDTHPLGCAFSPAIRHAGFLSANPDARDARYATRFGIYSPGCGLDAVTMSYGHDEYLYWIVRDHVPYELAWQIRYHSFQSVAGEYLHLFDARDHELRESRMKPFARYDLYTKHANEVSSAYLDEYLALLDRRFPAPLDW